MGKPEKWKPEEWTKFAAFNTVNKSGPHHPLDEKKWNDFVITAYRYETELIDDDVESQMVTEKWPSELATEYGARFERDLSLLKQFVSASS